MLAAQAIQSIAPGQGPSVSGTDVLPRTLQRQVPDADAYSGKQAIGGIASKARSSAFIVQWSIFRLPSKFVVVLQMIDFRDVESK